MFKQLIENGEKVFSSDLGPTNSIRTVLHDLHEKGGLDTAILLIEGEKKNFLLFILEDECYALYQLFRETLATLAFSDFIKQTTSFKGTVSLYTLSPVLFKSLLMMAQKPAMILPAALNDSDRLFHFLSKKKKDSVLALKKKDHLNVFYFYKGDVRDSYFGKSSKTVKKALPQKKKLEAALSEEDLLSILLFEPENIHAAQDCKEAMHEIANVPETALDGQHHLEDDEKTPVPFEVLSEKSSKTDFKSDDPKHIWVEVLTGSRAGFLIRFSRKPVKLGRGKVDVQLNDPQISRVHAELEWTASGLFIRDHNSTNGLFVNDEKVKEMKLTLEDEIRLGDISLKAVPAS